MACLLQPECNFLHGYFRCRLPVEVVDVEVKIMSMQGTHIFRPDRTTQLIKCTPWNTRLCPHPTIIKKMKTFVEVEGKMGLIPASQFRPPVPDTNPNIRKDAEKRIRAVPKRFRPIQLPSLLPHICLLLYQRPQSSPNQMIQETDPHLQRMFQFMRALHGLAQEKCQVTFLKTEIGYSLQITWTMKIRMRPVSLAQGPL